MHHDYNSILQLIKLGESDSLEFKASTGQLERAMETLCAFLNTKGGTIIFGVTDNGEIKGQDVSDTTKRAIAECLMRIEPPADIDVSGVLT